MRTDRFGISNHFSFFEETVLNTVFHQILAYECLVIDEKLQFTRRALLKNSFTLHNGCAVLWGVLSTAGVFIAVGGYLEYHGDVQYHGGYHDKCGGYLEYRGDKIFCYLSTPMVLNTPHGTHNIPHMYHDIPPRYSNHKK